MIKNKTTKQSRNEALERIILDSLGEHPLWFQGGGTRESGSVWFVWKAAALRLVGALVGLKASHGLGW